VHWKEGRKLTSEAFQGKKLQELEAEARQFKYYWLYLLLQEKMKFEH